MPILFCNIAWMKNYAGRDAKDPPKGGGKHVDDHGECGEECNFVPGDDGFVYGHFETVKGDQDRQVVLENLGASKKDSFIDGVDIFWTAPTEGLSPRTIVGWSRNARLYRRRQNFNGHYPSDQHENDEIQSFMVRSKVDDVVLLPPVKRTIDLQHGKGWSGQASWWYIEKSNNADAKKFLKSVRALMDNQYEPLSKPSKKQSAGKKGRAGEAAEDAYQRYVEAYEITVSPKHSNLQKSFKDFLCHNHRKIDFPKCFRDDLRYAVKGETPVMVEVKPAEPENVRFAIRTAIGQLLDYKQHQQWNGRQLVLVGTEVANVEDRKLALDNGFGLAWPDKTKKYEIVWPTEG